MIGELPLVTLAIQTQMDAIAEDHLESVTKSRDADGSIGVLTMPTGRWPDKLISTGSRMEMEPSRLRSDLGLVKLHLDGANVGSATDYCSRLLRRGLQQQEPRRTPYTDEAWLEWYSKLEKNREITRRMLRFLDAWEDLQLTWVPAGQAYHIQTNPGTVGGETISIQHATD